MTTLKGGRIFQLALNENGTALAVSQHVCQRVELQVSAELKD
jgi:hypothetical protein